MAGQGGRGREKMQEAEELRESEEWRRGMRKGINDELLLCVFSAQPYVKYPDTISYISV